MRWLMKVWSTKEGELNSYVTTVTVSEKTGLFALFAIQEYLRLAIVG